MTGADRRSPAPRGVVIQLATIAPAWRWLEAESAAPKPFTLTSAWRLNMSRERYGEKFRQIPDPLYSGDCYQVQPGSSGLRPAIGIEWCRHSGQLDRVNRAPFSAFIRLDEGPYSAVARNVLFSSAGEIQTRPIKDLPAGLTDPEQDARQAEKLA